MDIDYNKLTESFKDTVSLTRTSLNNSPGFFINLNYNSDLDTINQYQIIGKLRRNDKTQLTIENILQQNRIKSSFPGPDSSALATTYLKFSGILSTQTKDALGNPVHELKGLKIYDDNGDERELNLDFKLETVSEFSIVWGVTIKDLTGEINQTERLLFSGSGNLVNGFNTFTISNPAVNGENATPILLEFMDTPKRSVTSSAFGDTSTLSAYDINGRVKPVGDERPLNNIVILKAELLARNRSLDAPQQSTIISLSINLLPSETDPVDFELIYFATPEGEESLMRLSFINQKDIQTGLWGLELYPSRNTTTPTTYTGFQADENGDIPASTIELTHKYLPSNSLGLNITSKAIGDKSTLKINYINGNTLWDQYVSISKEEFESIDFPTNATPQRLP